MATKFAEPGTSSTFDFTQFRNTTTANGSIVSSVTNPNGQVRSIKCTVNSGGTGRRAACSMPLAVISNTAQRTSCYFQFDQLPDGYADGGGGVNADFILVALNGGGALSWAVSLDNTGKLRIMDKNAVTGATGTTTLAINTLYRVSYCWTITNATTNVFKLFLSPAGGGAGVLEATATNITVDNTATQFFWGPESWDATTHASNLYFTDLYIDDAATNDDTGNIHVTAKRPFANGTTNGFSTQIGAGGSGYGTGHAPQVNERALSTTNGWSMIGAGSAITEEYNIEGAAVGDVSLATATLVDYVGWAYVTALAGETGQIIVNGAASNISITTANVMFTKAAASTTYPAGTGADIGIITSTALTTVSLFEAGIIFVYIPGASGGTVFIMNAGTQRRPYQMASTTGGDPIMRGQA